jgi:hypothetical protein
MNEVLRLSAPQNDGKMEPVMSFFEREGGSSRNKILCRCAPLNDTIRRTLH